MPITSDELRQKYLDFFVSKKHVSIKSASLIPENDPTVLFTTAGMQPLVPYLLGEVHPQGKRIVDVQKCVRTDDIEEVGDTTHHTFFEMLGNWSLGDYFKKEAIAWSFEFLTSPKWLGLDKNLLAVSVFSGDSDAPFDQEAYDTWASLGISEKRIAKLPKKQNWWGPAGQTGPCGPSSEMFYWVGDPAEVPESFNDDNVLWVEIWNDVFMEFNKKEDGTFEPLTQKNIDTGMGMERALATINGLDDNFKTTLFTNIIAKIEQLSGKKYGQSQEVMKAMRVIADHLRGVTFIMGDEHGVVPSNTDQGYIARRLIRRAIRFGKVLDINKKQWTQEVVEVVITDYEASYPELREREEFILKELNKEEEKFARTLERGLKEFEKQQSQLFGQVPYGGGVFGGGKVENINITGRQAFDLYQSYGFPIELTVEVAKEKGFNVDVVGFEKEKQKHQELSRQGAEQKFSGGLADHSEQTTKLHTATHLLHQALRHVLGSHVEQRGSNITEKRLRFDFSHPEKLTDEQRKQVENEVNEIIKKDLPVLMEVTTVDEAKKQGALALFEDKYEDKVKLYKIGDYSVEVCGGPHVEHTGSMGTFKITKEESVGRGLRRIKAVLM